MYTLEYVDNINEDYYELLLNKIRSMCYRDGVYPDGKYGKYIIKDITTSDYILNQVEIISAYSTYTDMNYLILLELELEYNIIPIRQLVYIAENIDTYISICRKYDGDYLDEDELTRNSIIHLLEVGGFEVNI